MCNNWHQVFAELCEAHNVGTLCVFLEDVLTRLENSIDHEVADFSHKAVDVINSLHDAG